MNPENPKFDRETGKPIPESEQAEYRRKKFNTAPLPITDESPANDEPIMATPAIEPPPPAVPQPQQTFTMEQLLAILTELKKPNEVEQFRYDQEKQKIADEQANRERLALRARENAERADRIRHQGQAMCAHKKENGTTAFAGQVNSDGNTRFLCIRCGEVLPPVKAPDDWKTGGVNTQMGSDVSGGMRFITKEMILSWHRTTHPNCQAQCCKRVQELALA